PLPLMVEADRDRLTQVLVNLVSNAIKFRGEAPAIALSAAAEGEDAVLRVRDYGPGVSAEVLPKLFTKFAGSTVANTSGAGLGLAIAREITIGLGGSLVLESTGPEGSVFALRLPLATVSA
ncbi:MAG: ATP-binding protein, partial [Pseudomonadota bacterium]